MNFIIPVKFYGPWSGAIESKVKLVRNTYDVKITLTSDVIGELTKPGERIVSTTALPAVYAPVQKMSFPIIIINGGVQLVGVLEVSKSGWVTIVLPSGEGFDAAGNCGFLATSVGYHL